MSYEVKEIIGIIATLCVIVSFTQRELVKIRLINVIGAVIFVVYGFLIDSYSITILNGILIFIHLYNIGRGT